MSVAQLQTSEFGMRNVEALVAKLDLHRPAHKALGGAGLPRRGYLGVFGDQILILGYPEQLLSP